MSRIRVNKVLLTVRIEPDTKQQLQVFAKSLGLTSSRLVCGLIVQAIRDKRVFLSTQIRGTYRPPRLVDDD